MNTNTEAQIETISDADFEALMGDTPDKAAITPEHILGGEKPVKDAPKPESKDIKTDKKAVVNTTTDDNSSITEVENLDEVLKEAGTGDDDISTESTIVDGVDVSEIFKALAQGLIERGQWVEFDGMEDFEWTEENYGELATVQAQWKAEAAHEEMINQTGEKGKIIFEHIKNGGDPDEIISLFKDSVRIDAFDISTENGQEAIVREYYSKLSWPDSKINKYVKNLIDSGDLESEAKESKELLGEEFNKKVEETKKAQEEYIKEQKRLETEFADNMVNVVKGRKDMADKDKKEILDSLLKYDKKLSNGRVVNQFTIDFMKLQADPERYIDLVAFVRNPEKFLNKQAKQVEIKEAKKTWNFIKGNGSLSKSAGTKKDVNTTKSGDFKIDYKSFNKS